ncbi:hypothetical protein MBM_08980 [Drepanopeziza brunnea f. sp. 'multigermtubi' MB_m1]|uniref:Uncharacterized protein n=1 Tax=Marssonina brunnea f. sp. multigermtubi (strain MB_m1) TaxID=1072389 RepID=K1WIT8_MARBU|nr:uncharacterized protein MBM_08980 [Drepanopeziza brunnea f. sp. 'multigermtubi' MB_m1]EKD12751.1 hypothetical protein MBM_08980 [Drepanopeziza brunnea f. sp. 'multigermtubi' MB_m1]
MPVQRTIFGRPIRPLPPKQMTILLGTIAMSAFITLLFTLPSSIPTRPSISLPKIPQKLSPSIFNPFRPAAHAPPIPKNKNLTDGESTWYTNWNWLSPFSSSVTLDENRSLLPPLQERPPIYTYYDHTLKKEEDLKKAENAILVTWRKAWWAQGFRPIILSPAEAMNNPMYAELQLLALDEPMKIEVSRWLAWENMGTGLLCNYLMLPMGSYEDPLLAYLRRGEYPHLTRFDKMGSGLFAGSKADITAAVKEALANKELKTAKNFIDAIKPETFEIEPKHDALAYYDAKTINDKYPKIAEDIVKKGAEGMMILNQLTVSHLHGTWRNIHSKGISVVKPDPVHMSSLVEPAFKLASFLAQCPESPMPASCPPNRPRCKPCVASTPVKISTPEYYENTTELYTIGTVPHPYTHAVLSAFRSEITVPWIRRESTRDPWLTRLTQQLLGSGVSGAPRVIKFKEAVASPFGKAHSLWVTAEKDMPLDLDWHFGFTIPRNATDTGKSETPVPGPERRPKPQHDPKDGPVPSEEEMAQELELLKRAKEFGVQRTSEEEKIRGAIEAWNLADTEAWRFARAFLARSRVERLKWEEEEKKYAGGAGAERKKSEGWGRWFDDK